MSASYSSSNFRDVISIETKYFDEFVRVLEYYYDSLSRCNAIGDDIAFFRESFSQKEVKARKIGVFQLKGLDILKFQCAFRHFINTQKHLGLDFSREQRLLNLINSLVDG